MCHLCGARVRTLLPHKCRVPSNYINNFSVNSSGNNLVRNSNDLQDGVRVRFLASRPRGRATTQCSKKGSEKVLGRVLGKGSQKGSEKGACFGFYNKKGFWGRVLRRVPRRGPALGFTIKKGSQKGF